MELIKKVDSFGEIKKLSSDSVDLIVTSPPYNIGKAYETREELGLYLDKYREFANECFRVLTDDGNVAWQVGNFSDKGEVFPLDIAFYEIFKDAGFVLRNRIVWHFRHGMHAKYRLSGRYETIMWFAKNPRSTFNLDPIRIPNLYPGKTASKGPRKGQVTSNPLGKNPGDFWALGSLEEWETLIWDIPNVKSKHPEKTEVHPCQFPFELADRLIVGLSNEGDTVLDPFMGVGTTALAASRRGRNFIGYELDSTYIRTARERLRNFKSGKIRVREAGTPIQQPQTPK